MSPIADAGDQVDEAYLQFAFMRFDLSAFAHRRRCIRSWVLLRVCLEPVDAMFWKFTIAIFAFYFSYMEKRTRAIPYCFLNVLLKSVHFGSKME